MQLVTQRHDHVPTETLVRPARTNRRRTWWSATGGLVLLVVIGLVIGLTGKPFAGDRDEAVRTAASDAIEALRAGDLAALEASLVAHRGQPDFAYFFASEATPRDLGDALPKLADATWRAPLKTDAPNLRLRPWFPTGVPAALGQAARRDQLRYPAGQGVEAEQPETPSVSASGSWTSTLPN